MKRVSKQNELYILEIERDVWIPALVLKVHAATVGALLQFANSDTYAKYISTANSVQILHSILTS